MPTLNEVMFTKWLKSYKEKKCLSTCREVDSQMLDAFLYGVEYGKARCAKEQAILDILEEIDVD